MPTEHEIKAVALAIENRRMELGRDYKRNYCIYTELAKAALEAAEQDRWLPISEAPEDGSRFFAIVSGEKTVCMWGKVSHIPQYGWLNLMDDVEDMSACEPSKWLKESE